jgi:hypothetical protein
MPTLFTISVSDQQKIDRSILPRQAARFLPFASIVCRRTEMEEVFPVSLGPGDRRSFDRSPAQASRLGSGGNLLDDTPVHDLVADDAAFADLAASGFELRFDENHDVGTRPQQRRDNRKEEADRYERHIDADDVHRSRQVVRAQPSRVLVLDDHNARVLPQLPIELPTAHVHRYHTVSASAKKNIREAAGRCSYVEGVATLHGYREGLECVGELDATPAHVRVIGFDELDLGVFSYRGSRLGYDLAVHPHLASEDQGACAFSRLHKCTLHEQRI